MQAHFRPKAAHYIAFLIVAFCTTPFAFAQTYQVGVPVSDTLTMQVTSYKYVGGCGSYDYLWFRLAPSLIPYVTGLSFQIIITEINGNIWSNLSDTVIVGDVLPILAPVDSGVKVFLSLNSSFSFITRVIGIPTVANENYYCDIGSFLTAAMCYNSLDYHGEGPICQVQPSTSIYDREVRTVPRRFQLLQNYPNPFNASTSIEFALPRATEVSLKVFTLHGEEVAALLNQSKFAAGRHRINWNAKTLPSGMYVYRLQTNNGFVAVRKLVLLK